MRNKYFFPIILLLIGSCKDESHEAENISEDKNFFTTAENVENDASVIAVTTLFDEENFPDPEMPALLTEIKICNPLFNDSIVNGVVPCSPKYFKFYTYNRNRSLEDAFLLQVRKGVNNYPFRRLLIFTRENDQLVLMNGIRGYLVEKRKSESGLDDLVVALVDNLEGEYMRYDVLLRYENGKYQYIEALGDIYGSFEGKPKMKAAAFEEIGERIKSQELIF